MTIDKRVDKEGNLTGWRFRSCVGRDSERRQVWRTYFLPVDDPRITEATPKKQEKQVASIANSWERQQKDEYSKNQSKQDRSKLTLETFIKEVWLPQHVYDGSHKAASVAFYEQLSKSILTYQPLASKALSKITASDIKSYVVHLQTQATTQDGKPISQTSVKRRYETLRNVLNFGLRFGYISDDPFRTLSIKDKPRSSNHEIDYLRPKDVARYMDALSTEPLFWQTLETLLLACGLRRGEVVGLRWEDLDHESRTISINRNITVDPKSPKKYAVGSPKSGHGRTVPIPERLYSMLLELRSERENKLNVKFAPTAYIFCRDTDPAEPLYPCSITTWQSRFIKRHGLPNLSVHDLRHSSATLMLESGSTIKQVQEILGHASPKTTLEFYSAATEEAQRRAVEGVDALLNTKQA